LILISTLVVATSLECYVGMSATGANNEQEKPDTPKLTQCDWDAKCCYYSNNYFVGEHFGCGKKSSCPDFKGQPEIRLPNSDGLAIYCRKADGSCKYKK
ncbi:hypothetical protein PMAYCL1PPCAC_10220, partial [Pristionchus mayeri]